MYDGRVHSKTLLQIVAQDLIWGDHARGPFNDQALEPARPECGHWIVPLAIRIVIENVRVKGNFGRTAGQITGGQQRDVTCASNNGMTAFAAHNISDAS